MKALNAILWPLRFTISRPKIIAWKTDFDPKGTSARPGPLKAILSRFHLDGKIDAADGTTKLQSGRIKPASSSGSAIQAVPLQSEN
ncbi:hypothetical protein [Rhizobium jaguaris]|uniref:hypothetical protein n=1 Tax=Rhizobium jaguaris TaxID=1312183 RepID=UPI0013C4314C|nr:hypothetical protein [Rhizobium jaguaris]